MIWLRLEERGINGKCLEKTRPYIIRSHRKLRSMVNWHALRSEWPFIIINGKLGEGFDTFYGVNQGDPLSTDLFGIMIEILDEYLNLVYPDMGVKNRF